MILLPPLPLLGERVGVRGVASMSPPHPALSPNGGEGGIDILLPLSPLWGRGLG